MKSITTTILIFLVSSIGILKGQSETPNKKEEKAPVLYISFGSHLSMFHVFGIGNPPVQAQVDFNVDRNFFMGAAYSYDNFKLGNFIFTSQISNTDRQNFRLRLYNYFGDYNKPVMGYAGGSVGASFWGNKFNQPNALPFIPTIQLFVGMKTKIYKGIFNISEFALGAPYLLQTSFGYSF